MSRNTTNVNATPGDAALATKFLSREDGKDVKKLLSKNALQARAAARAPVCTRQSAA